MPPVSFKIQYVDYSFFTWNSKWVRNNCISFYFFFICLSKVTWFAPWFTILKNNFSFWKKVTKVWYLCSSWDKWIVNSPIIKFVLANTINSVSWLRKVACSPSSNFYKNSLGQITWKELQDLPELFKLHSLLIKGEVVLN